MKTETILILAIAGIGAYLLYQKFGTTPAAVVRTGAIYSPNAPASSCMSANDPKGWELYSSLLGKGMAPADAETEVRKWCPNWSSMSA